jgi:hypothetical protein
MYRCGAGAAGSVYYYNMNGRYSDTLINILSTDNFVGVVGGAGAWDWEQQNTNFMANVLDQQPTPLLQAKHQVLTAWKDGWETAPDPEVHNRSSDS